MALPSSTDTEQLAGRVWLREHLPDPSLSDAQSPVAGVLHPTTLRSYPYTQQAGGPRRTLRLHCSCGTTELQ